MANQTYKDFIEYLDARILPFGKQGFSIEKQTAEEPASSTRFRIEGATLLGEIVVWKESHTHYLAVCSLPAGTFLLEKDEIPISAAEPNADLQKFLKYFADSIEVNEKA